MPRTRQRTCSLCVTELDHIVGRCCSVNVALVFLAFGFTDARGAGICDAG